MASNETTPPQLPPNSADGELLQFIAQNIDAAYNPDQDNKTVGFALIVFGFNAPGISNYVSNANRSDMIKALRETADRIEKNQDNVRGKYPH